MRSFLQVFLAILALAAASTQVLAKTPAKQADVILKLDPKTLSFKHPGTGDTFTLHLGDELYHDTGGITEVPPGIKGFRDATSSYWEPKGKWGGGYACAESLLTRDRTHWIQYIQIQYAPDTGDILITEDASDASPCLRHILFKKGPGGGYAVAYLCPEPIKVPKNQGAEFPELPSKIKLLKGGCAEVNGKRLKLSDIPQSPHPFSTGG